MRRTAGGYHGVRWSARAIALSGLVWIFACAEATSPENATESDPPTAEPTAPASSTQLQLIGSTLVDATDWVLVVMTDETARLKMRSAIGALAEHLVAGQNAQAKEDVSGLRAGLASLGDLAAALGPIGVALDQIDYEFGKLVN